MNKLHVLGAMASIASIALISATPAFAVGYSHARYPDGVTQNSNTEADAFTVLFGTGIDADAQISWNTDSEFNEALAKMPDDGGEWLNAETPFGLAFGSNYSSDENHYLSVEIDDLSEYSIQFSEPLAAGRFGWAVSDVDFEDVTVTALDENGDPITGLELAGNLSANSFNFCDVDDDVPHQCDGETSLPVVEINAEDVNATPSAESDGEGETVWGIPSVTVSRLMISVENLDDESSTHRIWLSYRDEPYVEAPANEEDGLASTGANTSDIAGLAFGAFALIAAGAVVATSRRRV